MAPISNIGRTTEGLVWIDARSGSDTIVDVSLVPSVPGTVSATLWTITAQWTEAVNGFTEGDISLNFYRPDGEIEENPVGYISHFNGSDGDVNYDFRLNVPIGIG